MLLKTYFASSVEAAMVQALEDLGADAMIVNSRRTTPENKGQGEYEVVFAVHQQAGPQSPALAAQPGKEDGAAIADSAPSAQEAVIADGRDDSVRRLNHEVERLARQIESLGRVLRRGPGADATRLGADAVEVLETAVEAGFTEDFVLSSLEPPKTTEPGTPGSLRLQLMQCWARAVKTTAVLGKPGHGRKTIALVGPAGAGKSAMIAKLAAHSCVAARRSGQIISLDSDRIGAAEPLRMVAGILGVGFQVIEDGFLGEAIEQHRKRDLVFIDTPGFAGDEASAAGQLAAIFRRHDEIDIHLVLPATMKPRDLERVIQMFEVFRPAHFLFTRIDETSQLGCIVESALKWDRSLSFLSNGPRIPEDFSPADGTQLIRRAFLLPNTQARATTTPELVRVAAA